MKQLFLDVDGVLCDWNKGAHELHSLPYVQGEWPYKLGPDGWYWNEQLEKPIVIEAIFRPMDRKFWANLEWLPDGKEILRICEAKVGRKNICLLTNPWNGDGVVDGRKDWIRNNMPYYVENDQYLIGPCKKACAHSESILVDDRQQNIIDWQNNEGIGVMVPRAWNSRYKLRHVAAEHVEQRLHSIVRINK